MNPWQYKIHEASQKDCFDSNATNRYKDPSCSQSLKGRKCRWQQTRRLFESSRKVEKETALYRKSNRRIKFYSQGLVGLDVCAFQ